jgi:hypothetical protein
MEFSLQCKENYGILCVFVAKTFMAKFRNPQHESLHFVIRYVVNYKFFNIRHFDIRNPNFVSNHPCGQDVAIDPAAVSAVVVSKQRWMLLQLNVIFCGLSGVREEGEGRGIR